MASNATFRESWMVLLEKLVCSPFNHLTRLSVGGNFMEFSRREAFELYLNIWTYCLSHICVLPTITFQFWLISKPLWIRWRRLQIMKPFRFYYSTAKPIQYNWKKFRGTYCDDLQKALVIIANEYKYNPFVMSRSTANVPFIFYISVVQYNSNVCDSVE